MANGDRVDNAAQAVESVTLTDLVSAAEISGQEISDRWLGKRRDPRIALSIPVCVHFPNADGFGPACRFTLRDVSRRGIGLYSHMEFSPDEVIRVDLNVNDLTWSGEMRVRHCTETVGGFKVGLELEGDVPETTQPEPPHQCTPPAPLPRVVRRRATLEELRAEVRKAVRAYNLAQSSWGLLGAGVRQRIRRIVSRQAGNETAQTQGSNRRQDRVAVDTGTRVIVPVNFSWREVLARILDVSEDGITLVMSNQIVTDLVERELTGELNVHVGMTLLVGLGYEPDRFWIPGEVLHCQSVGQDRVRVGIRFATPSAMELLDP